MSLLLCRRRGPVGSVTPPPENNEPEGYTVLVNNPLSTVPPSGSYDEYEFRQFILGSESTLSLGTDGSGGESDPNYLRVGFPEGMSGGGYDTPVTAGRNFSALADIKELYLRVVYRGSSNWTNNGNAGTKFFFFSQISGSGVSNNHYVDFAEGTGTIRPSVGIQRNNWTVDGNSSQNYTCPNQFAFGPWHKLELQLIANTINPGVSESADGVLRVWMNGVLQIEQTNVTYFHRSMNARWEELGIVPTYGGAPMNPVPAAQHIDIDHWYVSGKAA